MSAQTTMKTPSKDRVSPTDRASTGRTKEQPPSGWLTPSKVMQKFRMKKRALAQRLTTQSTSTSTERNATDGGFDSDGDSSSSFEFGARNPFKVPRLDPDARNFGRRGDGAEEPALDADAQIWRLLASPAKKKAAALKGLKDADGPELSEPAQPPGITREEVPVDWSLKSRARCVFSCKNGLRAPFNARRTFSATEEASGFTAFVRRADMKSREFLLDSSFDARLREATCYWQHPNLPWMHTFPRIGNAAAAGGDSKLRPVSASVATDQVLQKGLRKDWEESLRSVYFMLKLKQCPYFYICASTFTCLFRAAGLDGSAEVQAFVCPTTKGMRKALDREEIVYSMPLKKKKKVESPKESPVKSESATSKTTPQLSLEEAKAAEKKFNGSATDSEDEEEAIESMLLSQIALAPEKSSSSSAAAVGKSRSFDAEISSVVDGKPESLVMIEAGDVQVFYGYFVESRWGWNTSGPHTGVPPSIYAPTAFLGASLSALKCRRNEIEEKGERFTQLDVIGPVMPHVTHSLLDLCMESPVDFDLHLTTLPGTSAFNAKSVKPQEGKGNGAESDEVAVEAHARFSVQNLSYSGLSKSILESMVRPSKLNDFPGLATGQCLTKVSCQDLSFNVS